MCKGLSTYDYIVQQRDKEREVEIDDEVASVSSSTKKSKRVSWLPCPSGLGTWLSGQPLTMHVFQDLPLAAKAFIGIIYLNDLVAIGHQYWCPVGEVGTQAFNFEAAKVQFFSSPEPSL